MATVNFINRKKGQNRAGLSAVLSYTMKAEKTAFGDINLVSGINCTPCSVYEEFINTKLLYGKADGMMYYHFVQSFPKDEVISPITAHEIALKLAEHYGGFEVLVATHTDREHIHSHFIINSVNLDTGKKLHQSAQAIPEIRQKSDELCMQYGLSICKPKQDRKKVKAMTIGEYHMAAKGKSWKLQLANIIDECMKYADSRETFIALMESENIKVKWIDSRKNITYELEDGKKCRDNKLFEEKYLKERMEKEFELRKEIVYGRTQKQEFATAKNADTDTDTTEIRPRDIRPADDSKREFGVPQQGAIQPFADRTEDVRQAEINAQLPNSERANEKTRLDTNGTADLEQDTITGWETEREIFFATEIQIAEPQLELGSDTNNLGSSDIIATAMGMVAGTDTLLNDETVAPKKVYTTDKKALQKTREKKIAGGHKADDHEEQQTYEMTMGGY